MEGLDITIAGRFISGLMILEMEKFPKKNIRNTKVQATANDVMDEIGRLPFNGFPSLK
jgi:hypothetical protein|tara:strand:- start:841 stop:1014 length:174 start_codon:yes stop_codon:yes gene_type:complete